MMGNLGLAFKTSKLRKDVFESRKKKKHARRHVESLVEPLPIKCM